MSNLQAQAKLSKFDKRTTETFACARCGEKISGYHLTISGEATKYRVFEDRVCIGCMADAYRAQRKKGLKWWEILFDLVKRILLIKVREVIKL
jgi:hypothetical protein